MGLILEVTNGPFKGKKIELASEQSLIIGRAEGRAQFAIPQDNYMSSVHFSVEVGRSGYRIRDLKSANGTLLNGSPLQEGVLVNGDEIKAGKSSFRVSFVSDASLHAPARIDASHQPLQPLPPAPKIKQEPKRQGSPLEIAKDVQEKPPQGPESYVKAETPPPLCFPGGPGLPPSPSMVAKPVAMPPPPKPAPFVRPTSRTVAFEVGPWRFSFVPPGWETRPDFGFQFGLEDEFPTTIVASEEYLGSGASLQQYVTAQAKMLRQYFKDPSIEAIYPPHIEGATETIALEIQYPTKEGHLVYMQRIYARHAGGIGVIALTTLKNDSSRQIPVFESVLMEAFLSSS